MQRILILAYLYLLVPFLLFCITWLQWYIALGIVGIIVTICIKKSSQMLAYFPEKLSVRYLGFGLAFILLWVFLSGIGGYIFQNYDHHWRNAILRDLITYEWPVVYTNLQDDSHFMLVYYIGFWILPAILGKIGGWYIANLCLFIWSCLGILIATVLLAHRLKTSVPIVVLFFIFFSGLDILGIGYHIFRGYNTPTLWPPFYHLEVWMPYVQYSCPTTQLFWVFHQAIPTWVCLSLLCFGIPKKHVLMVFAMMFFYAPLPSVGLSPFLFVYLCSFEKYTKDFVACNISLSDGMQFLISPISIHRVVSWVSQRWQAVCSLENIGIGGLILFVSVVYFSQNSSAQVWSWRSMLFQMAALFLAVESLLFLILVVKYQSCNLFWYTCLIILAIAPHICLGYSVDFAMRASIPALFFLMVWCLQALLHNPRYIFFWICLFVGSMTPIYEINRTVYRTWQYFTNQTPDVCAYDATSYEYVSEVTHPYTLVADHIETFANLDFRYASNFVGCIDKPSIFLKNIPLPKSTSLSKD